MKKYYTKKRLEWNMWTHHRQTQTGMLGSFLLLNFPMASSSFHQKVKIEIIYTHINTIKTYIILCYF